jgi:peroxiredoxin
MKRSKPKLTVLTSWLICSVVFFTACEEASDDSISGIGSMAETDSLTRPMDARSPAADDSRVRDAGHEQFDAVTQPDQNLEPSDVAVAPTLDAAWADTGVVLDAEAASADGSWVPDDSLPRADLNVIESDASGEQPDASGEQPDAAILETDAAPLPIDAFVDAPDASILVPDAALNTPDGALENGDYPRGPYGVDVGQIVTDLNFIDWEDRPYRLSDMRQEPNTQIIAIVTLAAWCPTCAQKMAALSAMNAELRALGVLTVTSLYENANFQPATARDAAAWRRQHELDFPVVADGPQVLRPYFSPFGRNTYILIDAASMEILLLSQGFQTNVLEQQLRERLMPND